MVQVGKFDLRTVSDGLFKLDGGAMFGIIPKPLWEKSTKPDEINRVQLSLNPLLITLPSPSSGQAKNILVDTGIGNKYDQKFNEMYDINHKWEISKSLNEIGLKTTDIDIVIPSHLHFDHMGGSTVKFEGKLESTFPNATYIIQQIEWENAFSDNPRNKGSYFIEDFLLLEKRKQVKLIDGNTEIVKGINVIKTGGHTPGHQIVKIESGDITAFYAGDLMPTRHHLKPAWCMGYDLFHLDVAAWKQTFLENASANGWLLFFDHETDFKCVKIIKTDKGFTFTTANSQ